MNFQKKIKKVLSFLVPKGYFKEKIKLAFYTLKKPKGTKYEVLNENENFIYKTTFNTIVLYTYEALYSIVADFNYYLHFYKLKKSDIVLDAGANVGVLSIFFSKIVGKTGCIHSFEPDSININWMKKNIDLNKDLENTIKIYDVLLWDKNDWIDFEEAGTVGSSAIWFSGKNNIIKKRAMTIDNWVIENEITKLDFIKMDIEGAEIEALDGCIDTIKNLKPNFAIASYHIVNGEPTYIKVEDFFKKMNYPYKTIVFRKTEIITFAGNAIN